MFMSKDDSMSLFGYSSTISWFEIFKLNSLKRPDTTARLLATIPYTRCRLLSLCMMFPGAASAADTRLCYSQVKPLKAAGAGRLRCAAVVPNNIILERVLLKWPRSFTQGCLHEQTRLDRCDAMRFTDSDSGVSSPAG